ncbi:hypothetical protein HK102_000777, partial [Quaeritorhiza haematococci]
SEEKDVDSLTNGDVYAEPGQTLLLTLWLKKSAANGKQERATLKGNVLEQISFPLVHTGVTEGAIDFGYTFYAKQEKIFEDEVAFEGFWKGVVQYSKYRWAVRELEEVAEKDYNDGVLAATTLAKSSLDATSESLFAEAQRASKDGRPADALKLLTRALSLGPPDDDDEDPTSAGSMLRLRILAARAAVAYTLKAYRASTRDAELIERIYGRPIDVLQGFDYRESATYFESMLKRAQADEALGNLERASQGYLALMILKAVTDHQQQNQAGEQKVGTPDLPVEPVKEQTHLSTSIAAEIIDAAQKGMKRMQHDPNAFTIFTLKVTIEGLEPDPPVWRKLEVTGETTLAELREFVLTAVGWCGGCVHEFEVHDHGPVKFTAIPDDPLGVDDDDFGEDSLDAYEDETFAALSEVAPHIGDTFKFFYDHKKWVHSIQVESIRQEIIKEPASEEGEGGVEYPKVIDGARACPPEKLDGPKGYQEFLKAISGSTAEGFFSSRESALEFAVENVGITNCALDGWGGLKGRVRQWSGEDHYASSATTASSAGEAAIKKKRSFGTGSALAAAAQQVLNEFDGVHHHVSTEVGDPSVGGWDSDAFDMKQVNETLKLHMRFLEEEEDDEDEAWYSGWSRNREE